MGFRLVSLNLNGIRSASSKGLVPWVEKSSLDCMGVQELKAQEADLGGRFDNIAGMRGHFHFADKKGYSGVGMYSRETPSDVIRGIGDAEFDAEGRYVELRFDKPGRPLSLISCYFPSGSSSEERQQAKFRFLVLILPYLHRLSTQRELILVGDVNIAHHPIDLKNWKGNLKNSGFLPEEREWLSRLMSPSEGAGLVDVFRSLNAQPDQYTWWSARGQAWAKNVGWRIDYHLATPGLAALARQESIYLSERFSDHAPLTIDYDFKL
jgi:exodeoxyribonuclease-3